MDREWEDDLIRTSPTRYEEPPGDIDFNTIKVGDRFKIIGPNTSNKEEFLDSIMIVNRLPRVYKDRVELQGVYGRGWYRLSSLSPILFTEDDILEGYSID